MIKLDNATIIELVCAGGVVVALLFGQWLGALGLAALGLYLHKKNNA